MVLYFYKSPSFLIFEICFFRSLKRELFLVLPTNPLSDLFSDGGFFIYINELVNVQVGHCESGSLLNVRLSSLASASSGFNFRRTM